MNKCIRCGAKAEVKDKISGELYCKKCVIEMENEMNSIPRFCNITFQIPVEDIDVQSEKED